MNAIWNGGELTLSAKSGHTKKFQLADIGTKLSIMERWTSSK
jgi:hypothetical protein